MNNSQSSTSSPPLSRSQELIDLRSKRIPILKQTSVAITPSIIYPNELQLDLKNHPISKQPSATTSPKMTSPKFANLNHDSKLSPVKPALNSPKKKVNFKIKSATLSIENLRDVLIGSTSPKSEKKENKDLPINPRQNSNDLLRFTDRSLESPILDLFRKNLEQLLANNESILKKRINSLEGRFLNTTRKKFKILLKNTDMRVLDSVTEMNQLKINLLAQKDTHYHLELESIFKEKIQLFISLISFIKEFIEEHQVTDNFKRNVVTDLDLSLKIFSEAMKSQEYIAPLIDLTNKADFSEFVRKILYLTINPEIKVAQEILTNVKFEKRLKKIRKCFDRCCHEIIRLNLLLSLKTQWRIGATLIQVIPTIDKEQTVRCFLEENSMNLLFNSFKINSIDIKETLTQLRNQNEGMKPQELQKIIFRHLIKIIIDSQNTDNLLTDENLINQELECLFSPKPSISNSSVFSPTDILSLCGISIWFYCFEILKKQYPNLYHPISPAQDKTMGIKCDIQISQDSAFTIVTTKRFNYTVYPEEVISASFDIHFTLTGSLEDIESTQAILHISHFKALSKHRLKILNILTNPIPVEGASHEFLKILPSSDESEKF